MPSISYLTKDQNWQNETTTYWFEVEFDHPVNECSHTNVYGIVEGATPAVVYENGETVEQSRELDTVMELCVVTDAMREL